MIAFSSFVENAVFGSGGSVCSSATELNVRNLAVDLGLIP